MLPKKQLVERAKKNGSFTKVNRLLSLSHIILCVSNQYIEEASDLLKENGLKIGEIKKFYNNFTYSADLYFKEFAKMITDSEAKMDMFTDMTSLEALIRKWSKIDERDETQPETN